MSVLPATFMRGWQAWITYTHFVANEVVEEQILKKKEWF